MTRPKKRSKKAKSAAIKRWSKVEDGEETVAQENVIEYERFVSESVDVDEATHDGSSSNLELFDNVANDADNSNVDNDDVESIDPSCEEFQSMTLFFKGDAISNLLKQVTCTNCKHAGTLSIDSNTFLGFSAIFNVACDNCNVAFPFSNFNGDRKDRVKIYDFNHSVIKGFGDIAAGHNKISRFCSKMNIPSISSKNYYKHFYKLDKEYQQLRSDVIKEAGKGIYKYYIEEKGLPADYDGILDIAVSYDCSWHKRGHCSKYGVAAVIDLDTNMIIDFEVLSKFCYKCTLSFSELGDSPEYDEWLKGHKPFCDINFEGPSGNMEAEIAVKLWRRSIKTHKLRYTVFLADGDARTHAKLNDEKVYGQDLTVAKLECINHCAKRLGTALRNVRKKEHLGGRGHGRLTDGTIKRLVNYYRKAIKDNNTDVNLMKGAILATLYHAISTDQNPKHNKCPTGEGSWCFYNKAIASGQQPEGHSIKVGTPLDEKMMKHIIPIYRRLSAEALLERCLNAKTSNQNESFHSVIWTFAPKQTFVGKRKIEIAATKAVLRMNNDLIEVHKQEAAHFNDFITANSMKIVRTLNKQREKNVMKRKSSVSTEARKKKKLGEIAKEAKEKEKYGEDYKPGSF